MKKCVGIGEGTQEDYILDAVEKGAAAKLRASVIVRRCQCNEGHLPLYHVCDTTPALSFDEQYSRRAFASDSSVPVFNNIIASLNPYYISP